MEMFREAFICGLGMIVDVSGSYYVHAEPPSRPEHESIAADWKQVGDYLAVSMTKERPQIQAEVAKQLHLKLG
jgi:hypothetical protein